MFAFIISRMLQAIPVMLVVGFLAYALFEFVGDPVTIMLGQDYTEAQRLALVHQLGLDQPFFIQYAKFMWAALHGNFGVSYRLAQPVGALLADRLPATLELALTASVLATLLGVPLGVYTGIYRNSPLARVFMVVSLIGVSLPVFLLGILLILIFAVALGWLPSFGRGPVTHIGAWWTTGFTSWAGIKALILPSITLGLFQMTLIMRLVRAEMLEVLRTDYIKFARARGLPNQAINFGHALKNTLVPVITIIGLQLGGVIAFALVTETVFQWPGMGLLLVQSVAVADIPVMGAYLMLIALVFVLINLIVDLLYYAVDPRLRVSRHAATAVLMSEQAIRTRRTNGRLARILDSDVFYSFCHSPIAMISALVAAMLVIGAVGAPWLAPHNPLDLASLSLLDSFKPPLPLPEAEWSNPLGTDNQGRDVLSAIMYGARVSLLVGFLAVGFAVVVGVAIGLTAGYAGGMVDALLMRIADVQLTFPAILTALLVDGVVGAALPRSMHTELQLYVLIFAIGISLWPGFARTVRGSTLVERNKDYVMAARVIGLSSMRVMLTHVLPNVIGPVLVIGTLALGNAILAEATLSFLGVGLPPTEPSLGTLIRIGNDFLFSGEWWVTIYPGAALVLMVLAINLLGDWLRDALNPRLR